MKSLPPNVPIGVERSRFVQTRGYRDRKLTSNDWSNTLSSRCLDPDLIPYVHEHVMVSQGYKCQFAKVGMCREIFESMKLVVCDEGTEN